MKTILEYIVNNHVRQLLPLTNINDYKKLTFYDCNDESNKDIEYNDIAVNNYIKSVYNIKNNTISDEEYISVVKDYYPIFVEIYKRDSLYNIYSTETIITNIKNKKYKEHNIPRTVWPDAFNGFLILCAKIDGIEI